MNAVVPPDKSIFMPARVYTPRIITVSVFEGTDEKPKQEFITDLSNPDVPLWLERLIFHAATNDKMVQIEATPNERVNFMPNPNKIRRT